jgi:predicted RNA binding protein YcfA (HicA-like mRNA interferase family)
MSPLKRQHVRQAVREGWRASLTRNSHVKLNHPTGAVVFCAGSPSDVRAIHLVRAELRRQLRRTTVKQQELPGIPASSRRG